LMRADFVMRAIFLKFDALTLALPIALLDG
jgi:hypothetical protein